MLTLLGLPATALAVHGPADLDRDRDVDLRDAAFLQRAFSGAGVAQTGDAFQVARIDADQDVDFADVQYLWPCFNGPDAVVSADCTPQGAYYFPRASSWYTDISFAAKDPQSDDVIAWLDSVGGWGLGRMQIDFSIEVLTADANTPFMTFIPTGDFLYAGL